MNHMIIYLYYIKKIYNIQRKAHLKNVNVANHKINNSDKVKYYIWSHNKHS